MTRRRCFSAAGGMATPSSMSPALELARIWLTGQMPQTRDMSPGISAKAGLADLLEAAKFSDMKPRRFHLARIVELNRNFRVAFDSGYGLDHETLLMIRTSFLRRTACGRQQVGNEREDRVRGRRTAGEKMIHRHDIVDAQHAVEKAGDEPFPRHAVTIGGFPVGAVQYILNGEQIAQAVTLPVTAQSPNAPGCGCVAGSGECRADGLRWRRRLRPERCRRLREIP